jgi:hypothetical protein
MEYVSMPTSFSYPDSRAVLRSTPSVLESMLSPLPPAVLDFHEGAGTWNPVQVVSHLTWGEVDDWVPRVRRLLQHGPGMPFAPFDREAGFSRYAGWSLDALLQEFARLRESNLAEVERLQLGLAELRREGMHPDLGPVTLEQLLATWVTHDYAHLAQISRVVTRYYGQFVGPWRKYFSLLVGSPTPA